jgi:hypothetical protein
MKDKSVVDAALNMLMTGDKFDSNHLTKMIFLIVRYGYVDYVKKIYGDAFIDKLMSLMKNSKNISVQNIARFMFNLIAFDKHDKELYDYFG